MPILGVSGFKKLILVSQLTGFSYCLISKMAEMQWVHADWTTQIWNHLSYQYSREVAPQAIAIKTGTFTDQKEWEEEYE